MELQDRLFSERTGEVFYSVLMSESEYALYSESKESTPEEIAKAAAIIAGTSGAGALVGKALESKKASSIGDAVRLAKRTAAGAALGNTIGSVRNLLVDDSKLVEEKLKKTAKKASNLPKEAREIAISRDREAFEKAAKEASESFRKNATKVGGAAGAVEGAIENLVRKLRPAKKYAGKGAAAGAALGTVGYIAHKANNKKKGE
jgi:hypothetical protein